MNEHEHTDAGRTFQTADMYSALSSETETNYPLRIERTDLAPHPIEKGGTEIVLQRHGKHQRSAENGRIGSLTEEAVTSEKEAALNYFNQLLVQVPEAERSQVDVLFLASDTRYDGGGQRSLETAEIARQAALQAFEEQGIPSSNILNINPEHHLRGGEGPRPMTTLREPQMFEQSPDFVQFLRDNYGNDFWIAFEEDQAREERIRLGAEGPDDIADRMAYSVEVMARYARTYHAAKPDRRLIIWAATHYDTISPYVKREVFGVSKEVPLKVDYGAGITIDINRAGQAKTKIAQTAYAVEL